MALGSYSFFINKFVKTLKILINRECKALTKAKMLELGVNILSLSANALVIYIAFNSMMNDKISVGDFVVFFSSLTSMFDMINSVFHHVANEPSRLVLAINYMNLMNIKERSGSDIILSDTPDIQLKNVSFSYPKSKVKAVENVSVDIPYGSLVALVGENGSSKSTLIKLITGVFTPTQGEVLIDGHSTNAVIVD